MEARPQDKKFYSDSFHYFDAENRAEFNSHVTTVSQYIDAIAPQLAGQAERKDSMEIVELGAGTCLSSLMIRKRFPAARLTCVDISLSRMRSLIDKSADLLGTTSDDINLVEADFTFPLPFGDSQFDIVVFDAALHHSRDIWTTLTECRRVLRSNGAIAALREQYLAPMSYRMALDRLLRSPEVQAGVAENAYLKAQYAYYFRANGFDPNFLSVCPNWKWRLLSPLNGLLFSKWSIWAPLAAKNQVRT